MNQENIASLSVEDLLGLMNSPQEELVAEVRNLLKDQFLSVNDKWLINGLLDYFFSTNSKRVLDLIIGAPEPHSRYLLEKISGGIRSSADRFRYVSILLYAVSRHPPPLWVQKVPNTIIKDLLEILSPSKESDISILVSGVVVLVLLLPSFPFEFAKYSQKIFDCFWCLVHWTPYRDQDPALKPYLQVAVCSLFHRLYALYPCNLLGFLRANMVGQARKSCFLYTLRPMLERVRLHPLLVSETKETEVSKSRWIGLEPRDLIHECAKLCLDPLQEICEETYFVNSSNRQSISDTACEASDYIILCSSENNFWSPGAVQSPSTINASVPHTPAYPFQLLSTQSTGIAESPPEAAVEATPETTPFTSPSPFVIPSKPILRTSQRISKPKGVTVGETSQENRSPTTPLSPEKKEEYPFKFPSKHGQDILRKSEKSDLLQNKLQEIQRQRIVRTREVDLSHLLCDNPRMGDSSESEFQSLVTNETAKIVPEESRLETSERELKKGVARKRKVAVINNSIYEEADPKSDSDLFSEDGDVENDSPEIRRNQPESNIFLSCQENENTVFRKDSEDSEGGNNEGLGVPSRQSMTEFVKTVKTNRLRFLSQCCPPPNISLLSELGTKNSLSPAKTSKPVSLRKNQKSRSFPNLLNDNLFMLPSSMPKRDYTISSLSLSPVKPPVETFDEATQTEESPIVDPHEQLLEVLMVPLHSQTNDMEEIKKMPSPYELLDQYIEFSCRGEAVLCHETGLDNFSGAIPEKCKNHLRAMHCLLMFERYKREVHAERTRRLLGKIKKLHSLQEKDLQNYREKECLKQEMFSMRQTIQKFQEKNASLEKKMCDMVDKKSLVEIKKKQESASLQRDHLKVLCESLKKEKSALTKELENTNSTIRECQRQLKIHLRHSNDNKVLRNQVEDLNKKNLIMGEIQLEMHQQMKNFKESQRKSRSNALAMEKAAFDKKIQDLEYKNKAEKTSLEAAMFRIYELEKKLMVQHNEKLNHGKEIESTISLWKERCDALEKSNKELRSVNITLESQMSQLLVYRPERENDEWAESRPLVPPRRDGFPPPANHEGSRRSSSNIVPGSFLDRITSTNFRPIGLSNPDK